MAKNRDAAVTISMLPLSRNNPYFLSVHYSLLLHLCTMHIRILTVYSYTFVLACFDGINLCARPSFCATSFDDEYTYIESCIRLWLCGSAVRIYTFSSTTLI